MTSAALTSSHEGWLYLAVLLDLFSRQVIGGSMGSRIDTDLVLNALLMALWRRQPKDTVLVRRPRLSIYGPGLARFSAGPQPGQQHEQA